MIPRCQVDPQAGPDNGVPSCPCRHRRGTGGALNPAGLTRPQRRNLAPRLPRAPQRRAGPRAAARSRHWTRHTQGSARQVRLPGTRRNLPDAPPALPACPGLSSEASPCFVCPPETPPRPPRWKRSGLPAQAAGDRGSRSGGRATSSPSMTWRGPRRRTWTPGCGSPPPTCLWSLPTRHPAGSAAPRKRRAPRNEAAASGQSAGASEKDPCPLGAASPRGAPGPPSLSSKGLRAPRPQPSLLPQLQTPPRSQSHPQNALPMPPRPGRLAETSQHPQCWPDAGTMTRRNSTSEHPPLVYFRATGSGPTLPFWGLVPSCSQPSSPRPVWSLMICLMGH